MNLEKEIQEIKERNQRVEADKAWETSWFRIISVTLIIYAVAAFLLYFIGVENFFSAALVPAGGYFLSVQSLPMVKDFWLRTFWKGK